MNTNTIENNSANEVKRERIAPMWVLKFHYGCLLKESRELKDELASGNFGEKEKRMKEDDYKKKQEAMRFILSEIGNYTEDEAANGFKNFWHEEYTML